MLKSSCYKIRIKGTATEVKRTPSIFSSISYISRPEGGFKEKIIYEQKVPTVMEVNYSSIHKKIND